LAGEEIPLGARIILICDAFDAMRHDRPYSTVRDRQAALAELRSEAGTQFDPHLVEVLCDVVAREEHDRDRTADNGAISPPLTISDGRG
jgi:HD-GYP domain-containing protein (c-di-GMP phosphodiesterase class II)